MPRSRSGSQSSESNNARRRRPLSGEHQAVDGDAAATTELRRGAILRVVDLLKHDKRLMKAFLELLPPRRVPVVTPTARGA